MATDCAVPSRLLGAMALCAVIADARCRCTAGSSSAGAARVAMTGPGWRISGSCASRERLAELYGVCCEHDIVVVEDDAYYWCAGVCAWTLAACPWLPSSFRRSTSP